MAAQCAHVVFDSAVALQKALRMAQAGSRTLPYAAGQRWGMDSACSLAIDAAPRDGPAADASVTTRPDAGLRAPEWMHEVQSERCEPDALKKATDAAIAAFEAQEEQERQRQHAAHNRVRARLRRCLVALHPADAALACSPMRRVGSPWAPAAGRPPATAAVCVPTALLAGDASWPCTDAIDSGLDADSTRRRQQQQRPRSGAEDPMHALPELYRLQLLQRRREALAQLREKFERDKALIEQMRSARKFRPY